MTKQPLAPEPKTDFDDYSKVNKQNQVNIHVIANDYFPFFFKSDNAFNIISWTRKIVNSILEVSTYCGKRDWKLTKSDPILIRVNTLWCYLFLEGIWHYQLSRLSYFSYYSYMVLLAMSSNSSRVALLIICNL